MAKEQRILPPKQGYTPRGHHIEHRMGSINLATSGSTLGFSASNLPKQLFINNEYTAAKNGKTFSVRNPKDNSEVAADVPVAGQADVDAAVDAAEKAFPSWRKLTANARRDILLKFATALQEHGEQLAELTRITLGAPYSTFGSFEITMAAEVCFICFFSIFLRYRLTINPSHLGITQDILISSLEMQYQKRAASYKSHETSP